MERSIKITSDDNFQYDDYYATLTNPHEAKRILNTTDVLITPRKWNDEYVFAEDSIDFIKYWRNSNPSLSIDLLADKEDIQSAVFRSAEIIFPDILIPLKFVGINIILPFLLSMISNYVYDHKIKGNEEEEKPDIRLSITFSDSQKISKIEYEGPYDEIGNILKQIDDINE